MSILKDYVDRYGVKKLCGKAIEKVANRDDYDTARYSEIVSGITMDEQRGHVFTYAPLISIILPAFNTKRTDFIQTLNSVKMQTYSNWQLCVADGGNRKVRGYLDTVFGEDKRIAYVSLDENLGISGNSNAALKLCEGEYVTFLDHDDILEPDALYEVVDAINNTGADMLYTDEDKVNADLTKYFDCYRKPAFNMPLLLSNNYICHMCVIKKELVDMAGGFDSNFDGAQDYDLFLKCAKKAEKVEHIPRVLYHWRASADSTSDNPFNKQYAFDAGKKALQAFVGNGAAVGELDDPGFFNVVPPVGDESLKISFVSSEKMKCSDGDYAKAVAYMQYFDADIIVPKIVKNGRYMYNGIASCTKGHTPSLLGKPEWFKGKFNLACCNMEVASAPRIGIFVREDVYDRVVALEEGHITNMKGEFADLKMVYVPGIVIRM